MRNGGLNCLSKVGYKFISDVPVRNFDTLQCSESLDNASMTTLSTHHELRLKRAMIRGMEGPISSRNSSTSTLVMFRSENSLLYGAPRVSTMHSQLTYQNSTRYCHEGSQRYKEWQV